MSQFAMIAPAPYGRRPEVSVFLSKVAQKPPTPYELIGVVSDSEWQERLSQITGVLNRGPWSAFERIYVLVAVIVSFVLPWPIIALVQHLIIGQLSDGVFLTEEDSRKIFDARMASFGILVGIMSLAWVPYIIMSCLNSNRLRNLLRNFNANDAQKGNMQALTWSVKGISTFRRRARLVVALPPAQMQQPSLFWQGAYLPPYIAQPAQRQQDYNAPPPVSDEEKRGFPGMRAPMDQNAQPYSYAMDRAGYNAGAQRMV